MNDAINILAAEQESLAKPEQHDLLPLDARERAVVFRSGGKSYQHVFRRLSATDWENFFAHVVAEFRQEKGGFMQVVDTDYASLVLYAKAIQRVSGYRTADGREPHQLPGWPECIPQHHRLAAIDLLMKVQLSELADDSLLPADGAVVTIDAMWNENSSEPGTMKQYRGLMHRFASPTAEHRRRFLKSKNRSFVAGGSRNGTTMIPSAHPVLVKLYDELIEGAEGYIAGGRELSGKDEIVREMDAFHKSATVARLFRTSALIDEENAAA
ncbi:MAG TPA: hypothetical protein VKQ28_16840 [Candidatus Acidoferrum sp.]|nr:hypothetical protein [Candidatus Acidoferrum sp.]